MKSQFYTNSHHIPHLYPFISIYYHLLSYHICHFFTHMDIPISGPNAPQLPRRPSFFEAIDVGCALVEDIGTYSIAMLHTYIYIYTPQLFPTVSRCTFKKKMGLRGKFFFAKKWRIDNFGMITPGRSRLFPTVSDCFRLFPTVSVSL